MKYIIRQETKGDYKQTELMTMRAFWNLHRPGCDEHLLVHRLRKADCYVPEISRVAVRKGKVVGCIMYSKAVVRGKGRIQEVLTFGPLCVDPCVQNAGIGSTLLEETLKLAREAGYRAVIIFGEPEYYPKHGFRTCDHFGITDRKGRNFDAFMGIELVPGALSKVKGRFQEDAIFENLSEKELKRFTKRFPAYPKLSLPCQWTYENAQERRDGYELLDASWHREEFQKIFNRYIEELSVYNSWLVMQKDKNGNYLREEVANYYADVSKQPYLIERRGKTIGLVVLSGPGPNKKPDGCTHYIDEIFVLPTYRKKGFAADIVIRFWRQNEGACGFYLLRKNKTAFDFWKNLIKKNGYRYDSHGNNEKYFIRVYKN